MDCPLIVQQALNTAGEICGALGDNQACYGNTLLKADPHPHVNNFSFEIPGDTVNVGAIQSLRLSAMNVDLGEWGVAILRLRANIPDTLPGQNVTFLLFGDVQVANAVDPQTGGLTLDISTGNNVNVRAQPNTNAAVISNFTAGQTLKAVARTEAADWLQVRLSEAQLGWVFAGLVSAKGSIAKLNIAGAEDAARFGPMQAFYFSTGLGNPACKEAPQNGILIQTPDGVESVDLLVNEVSVRLSSAAFFSAPGGENLTLKVVEGLARIEAEGAVAFIPQGGEISVPMTENLTPAGAPERVKPYTPETVEPLPVEILENPVEIAPPLTEDQIDTLGGLPISGEWHWYDITQCGWSGDYAAGSYSVTVSPDGQSITVGSSVFTQNGPVYTNSYTLEDGTLVTGTLRVIGPDFMEQIYTLSSGECFPAQYIVLVTPADGI